MTEQFTSQQAGNPLSDSTCNLIASLYKKTHPRGDGSAGASFRSEKDFSDIKDLALKLRDELNCQFEQDPTIGQHANPLPKEEAIAKVNHREDVQLTDENESMEAVKLTEE